MNDYWLDWKKTLNTNKFDNNVEPEVEGTINKILMAFSIKRTGRMLLEGGSRNADEIGSIHGIKALATIALFFALKLIPLARVPFTNRIYFTEV